jgi:hypothetical protein
MVREGTLIRARPTRFEYTWGHIELIRDHPHVLGHIVGRELLKEIHSKWIKHIWDTDKEDRALQAHRGSRKTTAVLGIGAVRWLFFHPDDRIAIVRKTFTDAAEVIHMIAAFMDKPEIIALWKFAYGIIPKAVIRKQGFLTYNFKHTITPEGSLSGFGLDGSITGKHFDKIICDDIITLKDRISRAERERTKEMIRELSTNIIDPNKYIGWVGTPWHHDDGWGVIPAAPLKFPVNVCGILTPEQIAEKKRRTTPFLYACNYDLDDSVSEGSLFKEPIYSKWDYRNGVVYGQLDAAYDGGHTCALTFLSRLKGRPQYQGVGFVYEGNVKNWLMEVASLCRKYRCHVLYNETNADKGYTADALKRLQINVRTYPETQNKHVKISTHLYDIWEQIEWAEETDLNYMNQILDYSENQEPDDAPDSAASLVREAFTKKTNIDALWRA